MLTGALQGLSWGIVLSAIKRRLLAVEACTVWWPDGHRGPIWLSWDPHHGSGPLRDASHCMGQSPALHEGGCAPDCQASETRSWRQSTMPRAERLPGARVRVPGGGAALFTPGLQRRGVFGSQHAPLHEAGPSQVWPWSGSSSELLTHLCGQGPSTPQWWERRGHMPPRALGPTRPLPEQGDLWGQSPEMARP